MNKPIMIGRKYLQKFLMAVGLVNNNPPKIEFGCGPNLTAGFVGCDIQWFPGVIYICNAWEICSYIVPSVVDEIYSRHFLEHLTFSQVEMTLDCWVKILKPSGIVRVCVPDIDYHIAQFQTLPWESPSKANPDWTVHQHAVAGFWGWQRDGENKFWDVHKSGYNFEMLSIILQKKGFINVERIVDKPWNLYVKAIRI